MRHLPYILLAIGLTVVSVLFGLLLAMLLDTIIGLGDDISGLASLLTVIIWLNMLYIYIRLKRIRGGRITPCLEKPKKSRFERVYPYLCITLLTIWWFLPIRVHFIYDPDNVVGDILPEHRLQYIVRWWDYTPWSEPVVYVDKIDENSAVLRFIGGIDFLISDQNKGKGVIYKTGYVDPPFYNYERVYDIMSNPDYWWNKGE